MMWIKEILNQTIIFAILSFKKCDEITFQIQIIIIVIIFFNYVSFPLAKTIRERVEKQILSASFLG